MFLRVIPNMTATWTATFMMASRYALQIFWDLATAYAYTLLALATKRGKKTSCTRYKKNKVIPNKITPTHNALDWVDSSQQGSEDIHHSFVFQDGLLKHRQEVLKTELGFKYIPLPILCEMKI